MRNAFGSLLLLVMAATVAQAQPPPPELTAPVNDFAGVIDGESAREMDRIIRALQAASGDVIAVATVDTVAPYADTREFAVKMFENRGRGIGQRGKDNGVLILVAVKDRQARIEVGYGLEEFITDGFAGETYRTTMQPAFRDGRYGAGLLAAVQRLAGRVASARNVTLEGVPAVASEPQTDPARLWQWFVVMLIVWALLGTLRRQSRPGRFRRSRDWGGDPWSGWNSGVGPFGGGSSGGFGGGFGGFGGGRSGGGGGGGGW
jgi:uncharacterized protein